MKLAACFLVVSAGVWSAAPADEPPAPAVQPPAAQALAAPLPVSSTAGPAGDAKPAAGPAAATPAKAEKTEATNLGVTEAQIKKMRARGYKPVNRNGTLVFCKPEGEIGTHFERTRCNTIDELNQAELSGKEYVNSIQQQGSPTPFKGP